MVRKILLWLFVAFLIYFAANHPLAAAAMIKFLVALLGGLATGLSNFAAGLVPS